MIKKLILILIIFLTCSGFTKKEFYIDHLSAVIENQVPIWELIDPKILDLWEKFVGTSPTNINRTTLIKKMKDYLAVYRTSISVNNPFCCFYFHKWNTLYAIYYYDGYRIVKTNYNGVGNTYREIWTASTDIAQEHWLEGGYKLIRYKDKTEYFENSLGERLKHR